MAGVVVRLLQEGDDASAAGKVVQSTYLQLPGYPRDDEYDEALAAVAERATNSDVVVAVDGDRIVGCLTYIGDHTNPAYEFTDQGGASFRYFAVTPAAQGSGVGKAMVEWCIARARADGKHRLRIHTLESMPAAQRLYERIGFARDPDNDEVWDGIKGIAYVFHC
ncbi:MAG: GNAT family N-acetyltransferase [Actinomycetia bacterium]|nr:GNAT family N-acetyltransferase [Actinomycetes bacterium]